jgi:RNA polymerase sigma-70 factor (sigma-E family)
MTGEEEFHQFVVARTGALSRTAYMLTGDHHLAEDLVQTALFKAAKAWHRIEGEPEAYVRRILYNENISRWRRRKHLTEHLTGHVSGQLVGTRREPPSVNPDTDARLTLEASLALLTTKQRTVLVLRFFEDLTEAQTAALLGISVGTVKSTTRQALARLRTLAPHLAELVGDPA